jgi:hypothetical protein
MITNCLARRGQALGRERESPGIIMAINTDRKADRNKEIEHSWKRIIKY